MHIAIAGNIGSGKTTLTKMLAAHYGWTPKFESVDYNPYLADFYEDMERWSFNLQVYFLNKRFKDVVAPAGLAPIEHIKSLLQRNIQSLRNLHHNTSDALPPDYVADFSMLLFTHSSITSTNFKYLSNIVWLNMQI